jgi:hypothetical protein
MGLHVGPSFEFLEPKGYLDNGGGLGLISIYMVLETPKMEGFLRMLDLMNINGGNPTSITLKCGRGESEWMLDHEGVPFSCCFSYNVSHIFRGYLI